MRTMLHGGSRLTVRRAARAGMVWGRRAAFLTLFAVMILPAAFSQPSLAGKSASAGGYIDALPAGQRYGLYVLGDSLASELADGLIWALRDAKDVRVVKKTKPATGLIRDDAHDWMQSVTNLLEEKQVNIAIIAIGGNDRQDLRTKGKRLERFSEPWVKEYIHRIDRFMTALKSKNSAVYWVGLPVVRSKQMTADYERFNGYYQKLANRHGIKFIDVFTHFRGPNGYTAYGGGLSGKVERLRDGDGIHFTHVGARKLAQIVAKEIRRDLQTARASVRNASPDNN